MHVCVPKLTQWQANPTSSQIWESEGAIAPAPYSATLVTMLNMNKFITLNPLSYINGCNYINDCIFFHYADVNNT